MKPNIGGKNHIPATYVKKRAGAAELAEMNFWHWLSVKKALSKAIIQNIFIFSGADWDAFLPEKAT